MWRGLSTDDSTKSPSQELPVEEPVQPTTAEDEFITTLLGKIAMSWSMARSSTSSNRMTAASTCQELGLCLEALGANRIDAVLIATEREVLRPKLAPLRSVVSNDLQSNDEYALSSCEELIFFVRLLHGALRRCRDTIPFSSNPLQNNSSNKPNNNQNIACPYENTVDILMNTSIELLYLSQFQYVNVAGRVAEAALGLIEEIGNTSSSGHLPQVIKDAILGCLETSCESTRRHFKLRSLGRLKLNVSASVELVTFLETIVHSPGGAWKKKSLLELCDGLARCLVLGIDPGGAFNIYLRKPVTYQSILPTPFYDGNENQLKSNQTQSPSFPLTSDKTLCSVNDGMVDSSIDNKVDSVKTTSTSVSTSSSSTSLLATMTPSPSSSPILSAFSSATPTSSSSSSESSKVQQSTQIKVNQYQCFQSLAERLIPWSTGRRKKLIVSPIVCHLLCFCPEVISDAVVAIRRRQTTSWSVNTSFSTTPAIKFLVDTYRNLTNSNVLVADVALNNVLIFARFASSIVKHVNHLDIIDSHINNHETSGLNDSTMNKSETFVSSSSSPSRLTPFLPLLSLIELYEERVITLLLPKSNIAKTGGNQTDENGVNSGGDGINSNGTSGVGGSNVSGDMGGGGSNGNDVDGMDALDSLNLAGDVSNVNRISLCVDFLEVQYHIRRKHFFSELAPLCLDSSRSDLVTNAFISSVIRSIHAKSNKNTLISLNQHFHQIIALKSSTSLPIYSNLQTNDNEGNSLLETIIENQYEKIRDQSWVLEPLGRRIRDCLMDLFFHLCNGLFTQATHRWLISDRNIGGSSFSQDRSQGSPLDRFNVKDTSNISSDNPNTSDKGNNGSLSHMFFGINSSCYSLIMDIEDKKEQEIIATMAHWEKETNENQKGNNNSGGESNEEIGELSKLLRSGLYLIRRNHTATPSKLERNMESPSSAMLNTNNSTATINESSSQPQVPVQSPPHPPLSSSMSSTSSSSPSHHPTNNIQAISDTDELKDLPTPTSFTQIAVSPSSPSMIPSPSNFMSKRSSSPPLLTTNVQPSNTSPSQPSASLDQNHGGSSNKKINKPVLVKLPPPSILSPSRAGQECLYSLLRLIEDAPWFIVGTSQPVVNNGSYDGPLNDDFDDTSTVGAGICATTGCLRLARVLEHLCCLLPLSSLDTDSAQTNIHDGSGNETEKSLYVGRRAVISDSREIQNFGGIDLSARTRRAILSFFSPEWINQWSAKDNIGSFVAVTSVVISALARQILHSPRPPATGHAMSEARAAKEILNTCSSILTSMNEWLENMSFNSSLSSTSSMPPSSASSSTPASPYSASPLSSSHIWGEAENDNLNYQDEKEGLKTNNRIKAQCEARFAAVSSLNAALLVSMCSLDSNVVSLASNNMSLLCDQQGIWHRLGLKHSCSPTSFANFGTSLHGLSNSFNSSSQGVKSAFTYASNNPYDVIIESGHLHIFRRLSDDIRRVYATTTNGPTRNKVALEESQQIYRDMLASLNIPLFSPSSSTSSNSSASFSTSSSPFSNQSHALSSPLSTSDCISLSLAVSTIQHRWEVLHHALFSPQTGTSINHHSNINPAMTQPSPPPPPSPQKQTSASKLNKAPVPRTFIDSGSNSGGGGGGGAGGSTNASHLFTSPPRGSINASKAQQNIHLLSTDDVEYWSSLSTWLCSLGGLRCYVHLKEDNIEENQNVELKSYKESSEEDKRRTLVGNLELRWLVEVDMVSEMLKAYPMGSNNVYPIPLIQNKIGESIKLGLGFHLSPNLSLHLFTKLHKCISENARDQRNGRVVTDGSRVPLLIYAVLGILKNVMSRRSNEIALLKQPLDDTAVATLESLLISILAVVKELTSNLEESGRKSSICSREDSIILRQSVADVLTAMMGNNEFSKRQNVGDRGTSYASSSNSYHQSKQLNENQSVFDDDLEKGFNISKDMTFVYAISKNFIHEVVAALFEWLYHSGIAGRFSLFSDSAAHAAALATARFGSNYNSSSSDTPPSHDASSDHTLSSQANDNGKSLGLELSYVNALVHLLRGLELQPISDFRSGRVFSQPASEYTRTSSVSSSGDASTENISDDASTNKKSSDKEETPLERGRSQSHTSSHSKNITSKSIELLGQREQLFRSYFHTLSTLLNSADHEAGNPNHNGSHTVIMAKATAVMLRQSCCLALSHLLGANLDISFRKYVSSAERTSWTSLESKTSLDQSESSLLGGLYHGLNNDNSTEASTAGCFLSVFTHLLTATPTGTLRALSSTGREIDNIILQHQDEKDNEEVNVEKQGIVVGINGSTQGKGNHNMTVLKVKKGVNKMNEMKIMRHLSRSVDSDPLMQHSYEDILEHLFDLLFNIDEEKGFRICCLLFDWTPRGNASNALSDHILSSFSHSTLFFDSGENYSSRLNSHIFLDKKVKRVGSSGETNQISGMKEKVPEHDLDMDTEAGDEEPTSPTTASTNKKSLPTKLKQKPSLTNKNIKSPKNTKKNESNESKKNMNNKNKSESTVAATEKVNDNGANKSKLKKCRSQTFSQEEGDEDDEDEEEGEDGEEEVQDRDKMGQDIQLEQLIHRIAELEYIRKQTKTESLKSNIFGDNTAGRFLLTDFLQKAGKSFIRSVSHVIYSSTEAFLLKNSHSYSHPLQYEISECLLVASFAESILGTLIFLLPLLPPSFSRLFVKVRSLSTKSTNDCHGLNNNDNRSVSRQRSVARDSVSRSRSNFRPSNQETASNQIEKEVAKMSPKANMPPSPTSSNTSQGSLSRLAPPPIRRASFKPPMKKKKPTDSPENGPVESSRSSPSLKRNSIIDEPLQGVESGGDGDGSGSDPEMSTTTPSDGHEALSSLDSNSSLNDISVLLLFYWILPSISEQVTKLHNAEKHSVKVVDSVITSEEDPKKLAHFHLFQLAMKLINHCMNWSGQSGRNLTLMSDPILKHLQPMKCKSIRRISLLLCDFVSSIEFPDIDPNSISIEPSTETVSIKSHWNSYNINKKDDSIPTSVQQYCSKLWTLSSSSLNIVGSSVTNNVNVIKLHQTSLLCLKVSCSKPTRLSLQTYHGLKVEILKLDGTSSDSVVTPLSMSLKTHPLYSQEDAEFNKRSALVSLHRLIYPLNTSLMNALQALETFEMNKRNPGGIPRRSPFFSTSASATTQSNTSKASATGEHHKPSKHHENESNVHKNNSSNNPTNNDVENNIASHLAAPSLPLPSLAAVLSLSPSSDRFRTKTGKSEASDNFAEFLTNMPFSNENQGAINGSNGGSARQSRDSKEINSCRNSRDSRNSSELYIIDVISSPSFGIHNENSSRLKVVPSPKKSNSLKIRKIPYTNVENISDSNRSNSDSDSDFDSDLDSDSSSSSSGSTDVDGDKDNDENDEDDEQGDEDTNQGLNNASRWLELKESESLHSPRGMSRNNQLKLSQLFSDVINKLDAPPPLEAMVSQHHRLSSEFRSNISHKDSNSSKSIESLSYESSSLYNQEHNNLNDDNAIRDASFARSEETIRISYDNLERQDSSINGIDSTSPSRLGGSGARGISNDSRDFIAIAQALRDRSFSSVRAQQSESNLDLSETDVKGTVTGNVEAAQTTSVQSSWDTFKNLLALQSLSLKTEMDSLKQRRVFYRHNNTFYVIARRIRPSDRNALLLLILEETLPLVDPSNQDVSTNASSGTDSSIGTSTTSIENEKQNGGSVSIVVDGLHFRSSDHGLPVAWFQRLKDAIQPLVHSNKVKQMYIVCGSTSLIDFGRDLLKYLGLVHLHPKRSPLSQLQFITSPSALCKILPDCTEGLPKSTWTIEHTLRWRWAAVILPQRNIGQNGSGSSANAIMTANLAASTAASALSNIKNKSMIGSFICTTDEYLIVERRQRFHATHPSVPCMDLFPLIRFHDICFDHIVDQHHRGYSSNSGHKANNSSLLPIVVITYLELGNFASLRFCAPDFRIITQTLRDAIIRCKQDQETLQSSLRNDSLDKGLNNSFDETDIDNEVSSNLSSSFDKSMDSSSMDPTSNNDNNASPTSSSALHSSNHSSRLTSLSPFASNCSISLSPSIMGMGGIQGGNQAVFGARTHGGVVSPAEVFGSFIHLALLHMTSELLSTRRKAFRLLLQVQDTFHLSLGLYTSFTPVALPGLNAALPTVSSLSKRIAGAAPQYTLDVLASIIRWLRARIVSVNKSKQQNQTSSLMKTMNSSLPRTNSDTGSLLGKNGFSDVIVDDRLIFACLNYAEPWIVNLAIPWVDEENHNEDHHRMCPSWNDFLLSPSGRIKELSSEKIIVLDVLDALAKLSAQPTVSSSFLTIIWAKSVGSNVALTEAALLTFARLWWKLEMDKPKQVEEYYKNLSNNRINAQKVSPQPTSNEGQTSEDMHRQQPQHQSQSQARSSLPPAAQLQASLPSFFAALSTSSTAPRWRSRSDATTTTKTKASTANDSVRQNASPSRPLPSFLPQPPPLQYHHHHQSFMTTTNSAFSKKNGYYDMNATVEHSNIHASSNMTYQCLLDMTAMLAEKQPDTVLRILIDELWDACVSLGSHISKEVTNKLKQQSHEASPMSSSSSSSSSVSAPSIHGGKDNEVNTEKKRAEMESKESGERTKAKSNYNGSPRAEKFATTGSNESLKTRDAKANMGEWVRVLMAIRPLRSISFDCLPLLSANHLPRLLHIFAMLIGRGPLELRATLFPILTSLSHTLLSAIENHRISYQRRKHAHSSSETVLDHDESNDNDEDNEDDNNKDERANTAEDDFDLDEQEVKQNKRTSYNLQKFRKRDEKRIFQLQRQGEILASYLLDPSVRLAFEGHSTGNNIVFNENHSYEEDSHHDFASRREDTEKNWNVAYSSPEYLHLPLNILSELSYCAQLLQLSEDQTMSTNNQSYQNDHNDDDHNDVGKFQWQNEWWQIAENVCELSLLSVNSCRSFLVLAHLAKMNTTQVELKLKKLRYKYDKMISKNNKNNIKTPIDIINIDEILLTKYGKITENIRNGNALTDSVRHLDTSLQKLSWFGVSRYPFLTSLGPLIHFLHVLHSSLEIYNSYNSVFNSNKYGRKEAHSEQNQYNDVGSTHNESDDYEKDGDTVDEGQVMISPAALFWPTLLVAALAKPNTFVFTSSVDLIHSTILAAQNRVNLLKEQSDTEVNEENGKWTVETLFEDYRNQYGVVDNAMSVFETCCSISFKSDFATALCSILIRGLHHTNSEEILIPNNNLTDANSEPSNHHQTSNSNGQSLKFEQNSGKLSFLSLVLPPSYTRSPRVAVMELLTTCAREATSVWMHNDYLHSRHNQDISHENQGIDYSGAGAYNSDTVDIDLERKAVPSYVVSLIAVYGVERLEAFITESRKAMRKEEDVDWSMSPSLLEASTTPPRGKHLNQSKDSHTGENEDENDTISSSFFSDSNFPQTEHACLAISLLFGYFLGGACSGSKEDLMILQALKEAAWALPDAFADVRGMVLPRLASILLNNGSRSRMESTSLVDAINSFLILAFEADEIAINNLIGNKSLGNRTLSPVIPFQTIDHTLKGSTTLSTSTSAMTSIFNNSSLLPPPFQPTSLVTNLDLDDGIEELNEAGTTSFKSDGEIDDKGGVENSGSSNESNDQNDDGTGPWGNKKADEESVKKTMKSVPKMLEKLGFRQLIRVRRTGNKNKSDEQDDVEGSIFDDLDDMDDDNISSMSHIFPYDIIVDDESRERVAALAAETFRRAREEGEHQIEKVNNRLLEKKMESDRRRRSSLIVDDNIGKLDVTLDEIKPIRRPSMSEGKKLPPPLRSKNSRSDVSSNSATTSATSTATSRIRSKILPTRQRASSTGVNSGGVNTSNTTSSNVSTPSVGATNGRTSRQNRSASVQESSTTPDLANFYSFGTTSTASTSNKNRKPRSQSPRGRPGSPVLQQNK